MILESVVKFEKKPDLWFGKCYRNLANFCHTKVAKFGLLLGPFIQSRKSMCLKFKWGVMCYDNGEWCNIWTLNWPVSSKLTLGI